MEKKMFLFLNRRHVVFINIFVFYISFSSLSGEYTMRGINELPDGFKINTEEIHRRRKLVEPYILEIAEKQRGWLETNHMSLSSNALPSMLEAVSDSQILGKYPVHGEIPTTESIKITPVQKNSKENKIKTQQLNVHNNRQKSIDTEERTYRHAIVENFLPEPKALEKGIGIDQVSPKKLIYDGNESNTEKPQSIESSDEAVSEVQFSHKTRICNQPSTVERMSKAVNVVEGTDTMFNVEENDRPSGISEIDLDQDKHNYCVVGDMKESFLHIIKKQAESKDNDLTRHKKPLLGKRNSETNYQIVKSTAENDIQRELKKSAGATVKLYSVSEKHLEKQKLVEPFLSSLNQGKKDWVETYHFSYKETDNWIIHGRYHVPNDREVVQNIPGGQIQERLFFQRWLKKLLNKFGDYPLTESISFYVTADSLNDLKMLSESGNIKNADELICNLISNASVHYSYNVINLFHSYSPVALYIIISINVCVLLYFFLLYYPRARILFAALACIVWHGFKMYQEKVAQKHAAVSGSSPAYCESILNKESGVFAHIKEFFRHTAYKDHCEKYYEALMIDPLAELSVSIVISDFVSSTFFQVFRPMGRMLNTLVKDLFRDLSFVQAFYLFILLIIICAVFIMFTLVCKRYKLNLPFFMGSAEPCLAPGGSRVEDVTVKLSITEDSPLTLIVSKNNDLPILHHKKYNVSPKIPQNDCDCKISNLSARRYSL